MDNRGKQFEQKFKGDWLKTIPNGSIDRLYDTTNGYLSISQISDYIGYSYPNIFYLECKTIKGNTFPLSNLTQFDKLKHKVGLYGVRCGVVIWFYERDKVIYVPIKTIQKMKIDGKKSININKLEDYRVINIPSVKKRVFMDSNYSVLLDLEEGD